MPPIPFDSISFLWGIGIGIVGAFATGFLKRAGEDGYMWLKKKINPKATDASQPQVIFHAGNNDNQSIDTRSSTPLSPAVVERISGTPFDEIVNAIEKSPPLQRQQVAKNYIGLRVEWDGYFRSGYHVDDDNIRLRLTTDPNRLSGYILCTVRFSDYRELGVLPEGAKVRVSGLITEADQIEVTLTDVCLHFYQNS